MKTKKPAHRKAIHARVANDKTHWTHAEEVMFTRIMDEAPSAGEGYKRAAKVMKGRTPVALQIKWSKLQRAKSKEPKHKPRESSKTKLKASAIPTVLAPVTFDIKDIHLDLKGRTLTIFF